MAFQMILIKKITLKLKQPLLQGEKLHETLSYSKQLRDTKINKIKYISEKNKLNILLNTLDKSHSET